MRYSFTSAALVASATLSLAAPAEIFKRDAFTVEQIATGQKVYKNGALAVMSAYNKYAKAGAVAPADVQSAAAAAAQSGSVSANPEQYDESYLCPVQVGSQTLNLDFDTGSSDLWVFSTLLPSNERGSHTLYSPVSSKKENGETWNISYGDGSGASGVVYSDKVVVGPVTATAQAVEAATSVSSEFVQDTDNDGLLGLAFSSINTVTPDQQNTFFDTVKSTLAKPLFAANLKKGKAGAYNFGFIDTSAYTGSITYVPVNTANGFWQFTAGGYSVGSSTSTSGSIGSAIADTGTTLMYLPSAAVKAYYAKVSGSSNSAADGGYIFPCSATLPNFNVNIGSTVFSVPGSYINFAPADNNGNCFGGIQSNTGIGFTIFGDIFLKSKYVVFDETTSSPRLGFAQSSSV